MKRVLAILSAAVFLFGSVACEREKLVEFDLAKATAPLLGSYTVNEDGVSAKYTPGTFGQNFNEKMPVNHSFAIVELDGEPVSKTLSTKNSDGVLSISAVNLSKALIALGKAKGSNASLSLAVRASMQDPSRDNGVNGFVDSEGRIKITSWLVDIPEVVGSPYQDYNDASEWSLIGHMEAYEIDWNGDLNMWTDGAGNHVAAHVTLKAGDQVKFRKNQDWAENFGGDFSSLDTDFAVSQDGPNIAITADGVYDLFLNTNDQTALVSAAFDPYPELTQASNWSVIGHLEAYDIDWNGDLAMVTDGTVHAAFSITITAADQFKFRQDKDWAVNLGGDFAGLDTDFAVTQDGPNVAIGTAGVYDLFVTPADGTAKVSEASGVKVSSKIGADDPGPEPQPVTGWSIIGLNGDWNTDITASAEGNVWTAVITANETTTFKWRKDGAWDENYGGPGEENPFVCTLGEPFEAVPGGKDIQVEAGMYKVVLDLDALTITVSAASFDLPDIDLTQFEALDNMAGAETWGIIGPAVLDWSTDVDLTKIQDDPEIWGAMNVPFQSGSFKFRGNDEWGVYDLGGGTFALDTPIVLTQGGSDMTAERGVYTVFLYPTYGVAYLVAGSGEPPVPTKPEAWSVIGTVGGSSWDNDFDLTNTAGDTWKLSGITLNEGEEFKIRADHDWNESYGGPEANDHSTIDETNPYDVFAPTIGVAFSAGSLNIRVPASGIFDVTFDYAAKTILIDEHKDYPDQLFMIGEDFGAWDWNSDGVVEMTPVINNQWGGDATGQFYTVQWLNASKGFKFCSQRAWSGDFWGLEENDGFTEAGGNCTVSADGVYVIHIDMKNKKVHVEPAKIYGIGDCFGGWNEAVEENLFKLEGKALKLTTRASGNVRAYAASAIATSSWWTREFGIIDGKIVYRTGDELAWPSAGAGQVVTLDFSNYTGSIEGEKQKENWGLIGWHSADSWSTNMTMTEVSGQPGWLVCEKIGAAGGNIDFKFRIGGDWETQLGAAYPTNKELNTKIKLSPKVNGQDPSNIHLIGNGLYDIYLNADELVAFIVESGTGFAIPAEWEKDPSEVKDVWGIIGSAVEKGWGEDTAMFEDSDIPEFMVIKALTMKGNEGFKFRANHAWAKQLTAGGPAPVGAIFPLMNGEGNADSTIPEDGIYDVYLAKDLQTAAIMKAGIAPPAGTQDTFDYTPSGEYKAAGNLWTKVDGAKAVKFFYYMNIAQDWSNPKYDNVSSADCPFLTFKQSTYKLTFPDKTFDRWQNQFYMYPFPEDKFIKLDPAKKYKFKMTLQSTETFGAFFKLVKYDANNNAQGKYEGATIWEPAGYPDNVPLEADKPVVVETEFTGVDASNIVLLFDFGGNPAGAVVYIKDIIVTEVEQAAAPNIKIDGNFDDWADVPSAEPSGLYKAFKVFNDADNFYFYVETEPGSRLWSGGAYLYLYFNFKNDLTQGNYGGTTGMGDNKYDAYTFMYLFGGSADAPKIEDNPNGGEAKGMTLDNIVIAGNQPASSSDIVKMEIVIPRANFTTQVNAGDVIEVDSYRSKDGGNIYFPGYVVK